MGDIVGYLGRMSVTTLLAWTALPYAFGIAWAVIRRSALVLVIAIILQRVAFIGVFISILADTGKRSPEGAPYLLLFLLLAVANTATLLDVALVAAGLKKRV